MATIHRLAPSPAARAASSDPAKTRSADIILFPGVRYERWNETHSYDRNSATRRGNGRAMRDRLEIND